MDYSTLSIKLKELGLEKTETNHNIVKYNDVFEFKKASVKVSVNWEIGGYVKEVGLKTKNEETNIHSCDKEILEVLIKTLEEYLKKYN